MTTEILLIYRLGIIILIQSSGIAFSGRDLPGVNSFLATLTFLLSLGGFIDFALTLELLTLTLLHRRTLFRHR